MAVKKVGAYQVPRPTFVNPAQFASGIDAEYGPQIAEQVRAQERARAQYAQAVKDVQGWYGTALGGYDQQTKAGNVDALQGIRGFDQAAMGLGAAFGGEANDSLGSAAGIANIAHAGLEGSRINQGDYRRNMRDALVMTGADQQGRILRQGAAADSEWGSKIADTRKARGKAYAERFEAGVDRRNQQQRDYLDDLIKAGLAGDELEGLQLQNQGQALQNQGRTIDNKLSQQQLRINDLRIKLGVGKPGAATPKWVQLDPGKRMALRNQLRTEVTNEAGQLIKSPLEVYNSWGNTLRNTSNNEWDPRTNPNVRSWRNQLLQELLPQWNRTHPKQRYYFAGGTLHSGTPPKHYDPGTSPGPGSRNR